MLIGQELGHYRIEGRLGRGGMGEVYLAHDRRLNRRVALKILDSENAAREENRARFVREARAVAALKHPNIVTIHAVDELDGVHFIAMELVEGSTLTELIPASGLPLDRLLAVAVPLAEAVAAAHSSGIVHRDLKPDNVMVDHDGRVKVLDFGLARLGDRSPAGDDAPTEVARQELTTEGMIVGTAAYMSPEQAQGMPADRRSDVFALGIILFQMASGRRPFQGDSRVSLLFSIMNDTPPALGELRPALPRAVSRIVGRCLAKNPDQRYQSAAELHAELAALQAELASGTLPPPRLERRRWLLHLGVPAALTVAAVLAVFGAFHLGGSGAKPEVLEPDRRSIAVLPFENLSPEPENEYFADGITEEITGKLARIGGLEVASRSSVARFRTESMDARRIGEELGVGYLLEGSVRKAGNRVRIAARLVSTENGFQLWSEDFDGDLDDVFGVQERTALKIADALDLRLSPGEREALEHRYTTNPQAYDAYLRGRALIEYFADPLKLEAARDHFQRALELDPEYPLALVGLSRVEAQFYRNLDPSPERLERAQELASRALSIDPGIAEAHLAMGQVLANRYRYRDAAERFRQAIRLEPRNAYAWDLLSWALAYQQPPDPVAAEEAARQSISLQASLIGAHYHLGRALLLQGRHDEAIAAFEQSRRLDPDFESADYGIAQVYVARGEYEKALETLDGLHALARSPVVPVQRLLANAGLGRREQALAALDEALRLGYRDVAALEQNPLLESLRRDPAYAETLARHGL